MDMLQDPLLDMTHRGIVTPLAPDAARPTWSVMIPIYNSVEHLKVSLGSVLRQVGDRDDIHVEVVDDCSIADDPETAVREMGGGRVLFYRQAKNVGHSRNFNTCLDRSRGRLVHILHADDWVSPDFYRKMEDLMVQEPTAGAAVCRHAIVAPDGSTEFMSHEERATPGLIPDWLIRIAAEQRVQAPSIIVRREVYEALGGFDVRIPTCGEDWEMWVRIAVRYPVAFHPDLMAFYQNTTGSLTKRSIRSGQNIKDVRAATHITRQYLPEGPAQTASRGAMESWANWAIYWAYLMFQNADYRSGLVQLREALKCSWSPRTLSRIVDLCVFGVKRKLESVWPLR